MSRLVSVNLGMKRITTVYGNGLYHMLTLVTAPVSDLQERILVLQQDPLRQFTLINRWYLRMLLK